MLYCIQSEIIADLILFFHSTVPFTVHGFDHCVKNSYRILETVVDGDDSSSTCTANRITNNKPKLKPGFLGSGIIRKLINGVIGLHDTNNYVKVLAKVSPEPLLHDLTYKALAKADPSTDYDKPAISEEAFEEASKEMYNDANGDDDEKNDPSGSDDAKNDPSGSDNAGGIVDSNTMTSSNADNGDVKNGAKISAEDDSTPTSGLKQRIMNEIKINKKPSTLKLVENILHELNTH